MSTATPLYCVGPPHPVRDACVASGAEVRVFDDVPSFRSVDGEPGLVVLTPGVPPSALLELLELLWERGPGWTLAVGEGDPPTFRSVSIGLPGDTRALREHLSAPAGNKTSLVDLREALVQIARTRHDVNNPLTAALAEIQILLMDAEPHTEQHESLLVVQEQLRRIRDLLAATGHLRLPRD